ncbi:hypothetical protein LXM94_13115 [Rhizobium sp. TRM95111]|uniref:hypothetical protein n=1 Tax=Rhizobium alarense TaxID=2846851 RepID=UPI001F3C577A|nr:hypothetical protein [Rhizobium alarense]MCF3640911.1 hypothetical protein [Rhizobium alarense]
MPRTRHLALILCLVMPGPAFADSYAAISGTAMAVTGDIAFDDFSIVFSNGEEIVFDELVGDTFVVDGETVNASVYSLKEPKDPELLNGNRLCGNGDVTYVASWGAENGTDTIVAVFTTQDVPESSADMCASYTYE